MRTQTHVKTQTRSALVGRLCRARNHSLFYLFSSPPLPPSFLFTRLLNHPTFGARKRRLSRTTSGRHICLARHQSERRGWNTSVAFTRDDGDDSNKHMASRAPRPPLTEEDACEEPEGRRRSAHHTLFMWLKIVFMSLFCASRPVFRPSCSF